MSIRRVVTGHENGRSVIVSDGSAPTEHRYSHIPGMTTSILWAHDLNGSAERIEGAPLGTTAIPYPGQARFLVVEFPPDPGVSDTGITEPHFDPALAAQELATHSPRFIEFFEADSPGMHKTPTVDFGVVLEGEIWLELDDGQQTLFRAGDVVVQQRTRHAWRNRSSSGARMAFAMLGVGENA
ncbi:cupin domain-containing protein [Agrobacterium leguminum]|uniref:Cupin type-2 domain-containing protein n=1 Tax=Agrobacterium deltaense NCPPB 1641 TaxID=1183425 RepID=A0A1S7U6F3_9HYPH|nr:MULTISPECIES: cupin domain-containing protein [Agrobacterium]WFS68684.1 cupin domain-containing protein [Agrobacterium leguminum]CVI62484.1 conserved hypothetical protein [Agrobacterium deltaense NCPPB 1641]